MLKQSWYLTYGSHASKETVKDRLSADFDMCFERCEGHYQHSERPSRHNEKNTPSCKPIAYKHIYFFHQGVQNSYVKISDNYIEDLDKWYHPNRTYQTIIELALSGATNEKNKSNYQFFKDNLKKDSYSLDLLSDRSVEVDLSTGFIALANYTNAYRFPPVVPPNNSYRH